jgi:hypothetical protein
VPAKFRTDNETGGAASRSEYLIDKTGYKRYALVNKYRAPGQVFHEGRRSFAYLPPGADRNAAEKAAYAKPGGADGIELLSAAGNVRARLKPENGLAVWDADVGDPDREGKGKVGGRHVGHEVEDLGKRLPRLAHGSERRKARKRQALIKAAQAAGQLPSDKALEDYWMKLPPEYDDMGLLVKHLRDHPKIGPPVRAVWDQGKRAARRH